MCKKVLLIRNLNIDIKIVDMIALIDEDKL